MKNLLIIPLIVLSSTLFAQKFQFGLKGGVNISNFTNTSPNNFDNKAIVGLHGGVLLSLLLGDHFAIQPEALISTQGAKLSSDAGFDDGNYKLTYLTIPVMFKGRFNGGFYLEAGPQFGFKLSESIPGANTTGNFAKNADLGFGAGLGFHGKSGLGIGGRYVLGLSKVGDFNRDDVRDPSFKNGVIQLSLFYTFLNNRDNP
ncbi:MAG TPA: porin family protein [Flavitalea sp.]|nr:porin family protein [Flavitalea sp.]